MINSFKDEFGFLSNFSMDPVLYLVDAVNIGINIKLPFPSSENAYQFAKIDPINVTLEDINNFQMCTAGHAKRKGQTVKIRENWGQIKLQVMEEILRSKFENEFLRFKLLETGTQTLVEGNTWGDTFWGVCNGTGSNHLGKLLMKIRKELQQTDIEEIIGH